MTPADRADRASNRRPVAPEINEASGLAGAGRSVQKDRCCTGSLDHSAQRSARAEQVLLTDNFTESERTHADSQWSPGRHRGQGALGYRHDIWFVDDRGFLRSCLEQAVFRHHAVFRPHTVFRLPIAHESTLLETTDA
ncbi:hypothetical protein GCM10020255_079740 [Rhodococcus baikonurensis]